MTENEFWLKLLLLKTLKNKVFICQLFSLSVRVHFRGSPRSRLSTWRILFCCRNRGSKAYSLSLYSRVYRQKVSISGDWSRASWQWTLNSFWTNSIAKLFIEIVMSLIILTSGNKIMINESELRLFMSCHCTAEFTGKRCQYQAIDPELLGSGH